MDDLSRRRLEDTLARSNGFLPDALDDNRLGRLTPRQAQQLQRAELRDRALLGLGGLTVAALSALYLVWEVVHHGLAVLENEGGAYLVLAVGLVLILLGVFWREHRRDLESGRVEVVEGRGTREYSETSDGPPTYSYVVAGIRFDVSDKAYEAFVDGLYYRAYFLPYSGRLVNLEVMAPNERRPSGRLPNCPVCGLNDRVSNVFADTPVPADTSGCSVFFFPLNLIVPLLYGRSVFKESQERHARRLTLLAAAARRPPLYRCRRDAVVFVPSTGRVVPETDVLARVRRGDNPDEIVQSLQDDYP